MEKQPAVYILASGRNGTLYTGVTSNLIKRVWEHKNNVVPGFTQKYGVHTLVWFEFHAIMESAIKREKCIKEWKRKWKVTTQVPDVPFPLILSRVEGSSGPE